MEGGKKIALTVVLVVVIVAAIVITVKRSGAGGAQPPQWLLDEPREKIDVKTGDLITKTFGEWRKLGHKNGKFKNPNTGKYTMVAPMVCGSCGAKIAPPEIPADLANPEDPDSQQKIEEFQKKYICPKCGKPAFVEPEAPPQ